MDTTEVRDGIEPATAEDVLRAWDWRSELKRQERTVTWLARRTERSASAVHKYASGEMYPPLAWLRQVEIVLGRVTHDGPRTPE